MPSSRRSTCRTSSNISVRISSGTTSARMSLRCPSTRPVRSFARCAVVTRRPGLVSAPSWATCRARSRAAGRRIPMPLLLLLFIGSGCAALIYEIVWFQMLQLVIGSSVVSLGVLLGTFMGGMCLGSLVLPRLVSARHHPLRVYAALEFGIGMIGLLLLWGMPFIGGLYTAWAGPGVAGLFVRGIVAAICLLPPTLLMGATLPAV